MAELPVDESGFQLTIDSTIDLGRGTAWALTNLVAFLRPPPWTIINRRLNGGTVRTYPPIPGELRITTPFTLIGDVDHEGEPYPNKVAGLASNLNYLLENVFLPADPVRTARLWLPGYPALDREGEIQFEDYPTDVGYGGDTIETTITVVLGNGLSAVDGS